MSDNGSYVRGCYKVPAYVGGRVVVDGKPGTIVGFEGPYFCARFDEAAVTRNCHPTWRVTYFDRLRDES